MNPELPKFVADFRIYAYSNGFERPIRGRPAFRHANGSTVELLGPSSAERAIVRRTDSQGVSMFELWAVPWPCQNGHASRKP